MESAPPRGGAIVGLMNRRQFLLGAAASGAAARSVPRPNVLFVLSDQFRADALGASGNTWVRTPNLDAFAASGVRFTHAYTAQALCTPARGALLTGCYPHTTGLDRNLYNVPNAFRMPEFRLEPNWPTLMRTAGYHCGYIGKWHLGDADPGLFDHWSGYNSLKPHWTGKRDESDYRTDLETDEAIRFLGARREKPFFLMLSWYPPHTPYVPPRRFEALYAGREHANYYGAVSAIDWNFGRLLPHVPENTLVIFTSDHGETFGTRMGSSNKTVSYDDSARVPLILRWNETLPRGLVCEGGVSTIDLLPTVLEAAGIAVPARIQGRSRLHVIRARRTGWREPVFIENITQKQVDGRPAVERAVRTARWKLILRDHPRHELYDLEADPAESHDLFARMPGKARELAGLIRRHGERTGDAVGVRLAAGLARARAQIS